MIINTCVNYVFWNIYMFMIDKYIIPHGGAILGITVGIVVPVYRFIVFEIIYGRREYISEREVKQRVSWSNMYLIIRIQTVVSLAIMSYFIAPTSMDYRFIHVRDIIKSVISFYTTDAFFYISHRSMHNRLVYTFLGHKEHHKLIKPTSHVSSETFTFSDGSTHLIVFWLSYSLLKHCFDFDNFLFILTFSQWVIVGQMQHGGKDIIDLDSIPFLEYSRQIFVKESMCMLHDRHHSLFNKNYSMTGIPDKLLNTKSMY